MLRQLGSHHVMVVHSIDGLDEISLAADTLVAELAQGEITEYRISPTQVGIELAPIDCLAVADAEASFDLIKAVLGKKKGVITRTQQAAADIIALNAGAAIYVAGRADNWQQGVTMAQDIIAAGTAFEKMTELADFTSLLKSAEQ